MILTHLAHKTFTISALAVLAAAVVVAASAPQAGTPVLDLTKPVPPQQQVRGMPGAKVEVIGGLGRVPPPYPLPLAVELVSISPRSATLVEELATEILLRNFGNTPFYLPASQNSATVLKQGNKDRRTFLFFLVFEDPANGAQTAYVMASTNGSDTVPGSWLRIEPKQRVRVLFLADVRPFASWLKPHMKRVSVRAQVSEWKYEDSRYFIENEAVPVFSNNTLVLDLIPPK